MCVARIDDTQDAVTLWQNVPPQNMTADLETDNSTSNHVNNKTGTI